MTLDAHVWMIFLLLIAIGFLGWWQWLSHQSQLKIIKDTTRLIDDNTRHINEIQNLLTAQIEDVPDKDIKYFLQYIYSALDPKKPEKIMELISVYIREALNQYLIIETNKHTKDFTLGDRNREEMYKYIHDYLSKRISLAMYKTLSLIYHKDAIMKIIEDRIYLETELFIAKFNTEENKFYPTNRPTPKKAVEDKLEI